jgi:hypothetical protein
MPKVLSEEVFKLIIRNNSSMSWNQAVEEFTNNLDDVSSHKVIPAIRIALIDDRADMSAGYFDGKIQASMMSMDPSLRSASNTSRHISASEEKTMLFSIIRQLCPASRLSVVKLAAPSVREPVKDVLKASSLLQIHSALITKSN